MTEVLVRHCTIRIVRHGGWSWGPRPRELLDRILQQVPGLIGAELETLFGDDHGDREIAAPVRISVPLSLSMLRELDAVQAPAPMANVVRGLAARVSGALREALGARPEVHQPSPPASRDAAAIAPPLEGAATSAAPAQPLDVLLAWARSGRLHERLAGFSLAALRTWHGWIDRHVVPADPDGVTPEVVDSLLARLAAQWTGSTRDEAEILRRRLTVFAAIEAVAPGASWLGAVRAAMELIAPHPDADEASVPAGALPATMVAPLQVHVRTAHTPAPRDAAPVASRVDINAPHSRADTRFDLPLESALPFLLLGPLARIGYLDTVAALFQVAGATDDLPLFAMALANKVLAPPGRGWLRAPSTRATAAAFALLGEAPPDAMLAAMARRIGDQVSPLDAVVATTLLEGHRAGTPLLLTSTEPGRLALVDVDGTFPIAAAATIDALLPQLRSLLHEVVLVPAAAAAPATLAMFDAAQVRFITDAAPSRGESWRAVRGRPGEAWWSNDRLAADEKLASAARRLASAAESAGALFETLSARPSVPRVVNEACESSLTLAACLALGSIAWELWREHEPTTPQLALARFHDLDGRLRADATNVRVSLPLGRRFRDLQDHGFLDDVAGVPWLGGRVLRFSSG